MSSFPTTVELTNDSVLATPSSNLWGVPIGTMGKTADGRCFRLCKAAGALTGLARLAISTAHCPGATGHEDHQGFEGVPYANAAAGATKVKIADTTARAINYYSGGYLAIYPAAPYCALPIRSSALGTTAYVELTLDCELPVAITTATGITAYVSPYSMVQAASSVGADYEAFMCLPLVAVASGDYFWGQTGGPAIVTPNGGTWPGQGAHYRDVFAWQDGTINPSSVADPTAGYQRVGYLLMGTVNGYGDLFIMLQLDGC